ncbi:SOS response-associated peptidase [Roseibium litorale]|uniref:Abasic site processing protein n=1 Tax=Roseibium litorale TaxID=2803841 RepID=A0ABR9CQF8_9HYPH|nr:SOS response-associated peptidase [Roseibium litorale]MBD8893093.1 SOS response-associated peptidase [Roseibium litorale]
MCGRFALTSPPEAVRSMFGYEEQPNFPARYNIAPTQPVATVRNEHGKRHFELVRWGLIPSWVKDPASFTLLINGRAETVLEKPSFRNAMRNCRCLFPATGFYEWRRTPEGKQPFFIRPVDGGTMAFAGLWQTWSDPDGGDIDTAAIVTTRANDLMAPIHDRMPAIILPEQIGDWLDTANVMAKDARKLLRPAPDGYLEAVPVSSRVNSVANDDEALIERDEMAALKAPLPAPRRKKTGGELPDNQGQLDLF